MTGIKIFAIFVVLLVIVFGPWAIVWALNTLFPVLAIQYTLETWAAIIVLGTFISPSVSIKTR